MSHQPVPSIAQGFQAEDDEHVAPRHEQAGGPPADCYQAEAGEHTAVTPEPADAAAPPSS
jgi:hypothetical protein